MLEKLIGTVKNKPVVAAYATLGVSSAGIAGLQLLFGHPLAALGLGAATAGMFYDATNLYNGKPAGLGTLILGSLGYGVAAADNQFILKPELRPIVPLAAVSALYCAFVGGLTKYVTNKEGNTQAVAST